jgi:hypothetical protein
VNSSDDLDESYFLPDDDLDQDNANLVLQVSDLEVQNTGGFVLVNQDGPPQGNNNPPQGGDGNLPTGQDPNRNQNPDEVVITNL